MYTGYEIIWLFFCCSFLGWILETITAAVEHRRFVNRGLINGPFCVIYGIAAVIIAQFCWELHGVWLFLAGVIWATLIEWIAGHVIERFYHERWWDYSKIKWNLDGYICLPVSLFWGFLCYLMITWGLPVLLNIIKLLPFFAVKVVTWVLVGVLALDTVATLILMSGRSRRMEQWEAVDSWMTGVSSKIGRKIYGYVDHRIKRAYPEAEHQKKELSEEEIKKCATVFAYGCSFHKIIWIFVIGAFLGDIAETLFCRATAGVWMSRSSLVWGTFSIVWGLAMAAGTILLYRYRDKSDGFLLAAGTFLGGAYEYMCSVVTELVFGKVFWDYSKIPFNLGGRINLLYCFFWGIAALVWIKILYPLMSGWIEKIPMKIGKVLSWFLIVFMCLDMSVSTLALVRSDQRAHQVEAVHEWQRLMDEHYDDQKLKEIYPNALGVD